VLQFVSHHELSRPDLGKEIRAQMDWDMIVRYNILMETDTGVLPKDENHGSQKSRAASTMQTLMSQLSK
jgi:hypothetical protein